MKLKLFFLGLLASNAAFAAGMPDIIQNYQINFGPNDCLFTSPPIERPWSPPPVGYDAGLTTWTTRYRMKMRVENLSSLDGTVVQRDTNPYVQARMPIYVPGSTEAGISSTVAPYHQLPNYAELLPFETKVITSSHSVPYQNGLSGMDQVTFTDDKIYFFCRPPVSTIFESSIPFRERHQNYFSEATLELRWRDLQ